MAINNDSSKEAGAKKPLGFLNFWEKHIFPGTDDLYRIGKKANEGFRDAVTAKVVALKSLSNIIPIADLHPVQMTFRGVPIEKEKHDLGFSIWASNFANPTALIASFLGLPTELPRANLENIDSRRLTWTQVGRNIIGADIRTDTLKGKLYKGWTICKNIAKVLLVPATIAYHIVVGFTEFLPSLVAEEAKLALAKAYAEYKDATEQEPGIKALAAIKLGVFGTIHVVAKFIYYAGRSVTSFAKSAQAGYHAGVEDWGGPVGRAVGIALAATSTLFSAFALVLAPIFAPFGIGTAVASAVGQVAAPVMNTYVGSMVANNVGTTMMQYGGQVVLNSIAPVSSSTLGAVTTGVVASSVVKTSWDHGPSKISSIVAKVKNWWKSLDVDDEPALTMGITSVSESPSPVSTVQITSALGASSSAQPASLPRSRVVPVTTNPYVVPGLNFKRAPPKPCREWIESTRKELINEINAQDAATDEELMSEINAQDAMTDKRSIVPALIENSIFGETQEAFKVSQRLRDAIEKGKNPKEGDVASDNNSYTSPRPNQATSSSSKGR